MKNIALPDWMINRITTKFSKSCFILTPLPWFQHSHPQSNSSLLTSEALARRKQVSPNSKCVSFSKIFPDWYLTKTVRLGHLQTVKDLNKGILRKDTQTWNLEHLKFFWMCFLEDYIQNEGLWNNEQILVNIKSTYSVATKKRTKK